MTGETIGEVVASADPDFVPGDIVVGARGWQTHSVTPGAQLHKIAKGGAPLSAYLGILGMPGATAYAGVTEICKPKPGETFVVSAASGAVGSVAGPACQAGRCPRGRHRRRLREMPLGPGQPGVRRLRRSPLPGSAAGTAGRLPERHRLLLRKCRRRGSGRGVRPAQPVRPRRDVRHGLAIQRENHAAWPEPRFRRRQARADPGLHRLRPASAHDRVARDGGALGRRRQPGLPGGRDRRPGERARRAVPAS